MMQTYFKLAWRNLFRNKRRTFLAGTAIGIGLAALIFVDALMIGMEQNMIHSATSSFLGEGQIHRAGYRETNEVELTINNPDSVIEKLSQEPIIAHFTRRAMSFAMISSPANVSGVGLIGIDPATERNLSQFDDALIAGSYFSGEFDQEVLIGGKLAEILEVDLGDRVVVTTAQASTGDISQEMFRVAGIYFFNTDGVDRGVALIPLPLAQRMIGLGEDIHELVFTFTAGDYGRDKHHPFWSRYSTNGNEAAGWTVLLPQMEIAFELSDFTTMLVGFILFAVVTLGIINTLFMSLHERMFEFGVLRAVGTRPTAMAGLILLEAASLAVISIVLGIIFGFVVTWITRQTGIDYTGIEYVGVTFRELLYPVLTIRQFILYPCWVFVFTVIVGLYPAIYAARMRPAVALRKSM